MYLQEITGWAFVWTVAYCNSVAPDLDEYVSIMVQGPRAKCCLQFGAMGHEASLQSHVDLQLRTVSRQFFMANRNFRSKFETSPACRLTPAILILLGVSCLLWVRR